METILTEVFQTCCSWENPSCEAGTGVSALGITGKLKHDREAKVLCYCLRYIQVKKLRQLLWVLTLRTGWQHSGSFQDWILFQTYFRTGHRSLTCNEDWTDNSRHTNLDSSGFCSIEIFIYRNQFMLLRAEITVVGVTCLGKVYTVLWA